MPTTEQSSSISSANEEERLRELLKQKRDRRKMQDSTHNTDKSQQSQQTTKQEQDAPIPKKIISDSQKQEANSKLSASATPNHDNKDKDKDKDATAGENADKNNSKDENGNGATEKKTGRRRRRRGGRRRNRNRDRRRGGKNRHESEMMNANAFPPHAVTGAGVGGGPHEGDRWYRGADSREYYGGGPPPPGYRGGGGGPPRPAYYYDDRGGYNGGGGGGGYGGGGYGPPPLDHRGGGYGGRYDRFGDDYYHGGRRRDEYYWGDEGRYRDGGRHGRDWKRGHSRSRSRSRSRSLSRSTRSRSLSNSSASSYSRSRSRSRGRSNSRSPSVDNRDNRPAGKDNSRSSSDKDKSEKDRASEEERKDKRRRSRSRSRSNDKKHGDDKNSKRKKMDIDYDSRGGGGSKERDRDRDSRDQHPRSSRDRGGRRRRRSRSRSNSSSRPTITTTTSSTTDQDKSNPEERSSSSKDNHHKSSSTSKKSSSSPEKEKADAALTKDQRTVFVSQLVMRADERDIRRFFKRKAGCKVNDVILLRDRRTGRHKGCAYVELGRLEDVPLAVEFNGQVPDFQRFPILVRASEAEKNYDENGKATSDSNADPSITGNGQANSTITDPSSLTNGSNLSNLAAAGLSSKGEMTRKVEAQNIYVGSIDRCVTQAQLYAVFSQFGKLDSVGLQMDPTTGMSRGFAFLSYPDAKDANLAIQTMSGQKLAGRPLKTGWANQVSTPGVEYVTSDEYPEDSAARIQNAHLVLTQLTGSGLMAMASIAQLGLTPTSTTSTYTGATAIPQSALGAPVMMQQPPPHIANAAEAALNEALGLPAPSNPPSSTLTENSTTESIIPQAVEHTDPPVKTTESEIDAKEIQGTPTLNLLVHNMFDKDEETDEGWQNDIREDFEEECAKYGQIKKCVVMHLEPGGKIFASFDTETSAKNCALALAGRWFDKRQLRVEYIKDEDFPNDVEVE